jgi:hypothetical protein
MNRMNLLSSYILGIKATRGRVRTPKAYAKENRRLEYISHEVLWSAMRLRIVLSLRDYNPIGCLASKPLGGR